MKNQEFKINLTDKIKSRLLEEEGSEDPISEEAWASEKNKGKKLNKPFRTPGGPKKFSVYVKNAKGNVVKVNFGDPNMEIKRDDPARRKNFRARHNCENPGPKTKARYWSCKMWSKKSVTNITKGSELELEDALLQYMDESEAKRPGPKSAAQTPAKPSERKKGSSKNKPGSAAKKGAKITFSEKVINSLKAKVKDHNEKHPSKKVTLGQLKKVYRRGAGAFSSSHRPGMTRGGWAMARVNMFLKMKRGGKVKESYRKADQDISRSSSVASEFIDFSEEDFAEANNDIEIYDLSDESDVDFENIFEEESEAYKMSVIDENMEKIFMGHCMSHDKDLINTAGMDDEKTYAACAMQYKKMKADIDEEDENGLTEKQKKLPKPLRDAILKKRAEGRHYKDKKKKKKKKMSYSSLWENIRKKKKRMGKNYRPAKPGDKDRPSQEAIRRAQGAPDVMKHYFKTKEEAMKDAKKLGLKGIHSHKTEDGRTLYMAGPDHATFMKRHKEVMKEKAMKEKSKARYKKSQAAPDIMKHYFKTKEEALKDAKKLGLKGFHSHKTEDGETLYMAGPDHETFMKKHNEVLKMKNKAGYKSYHNKDKK